MGTERTLLEIDDLVGPTGAEVLANLNWFRGRLTEHGIHPPRGSVVGDGLEALRVIGEAQDRQSIDQDPSPMQLQQGMGAHFLIEAVRKLEARAPHALPSVWRLCRGADVLLTGRSNRTRERDAMFEVFMGADAAGGGAENVELRGSSNPDVFFTYETKRIGYECKALYGTAGRDKTRKAIREKLAQIRDRNPDIDHAWIAVDLTATFGGHDLDWFRVSGDGALLRLQKHVFATKDAILSDAELRVHLRDASPRLLGIVFVAHSVCLATERMTFVTAAHHVPVESA